MRRLDSFFAKYEILLPLLLAAFFLAASLPGNGWGAPDLWNPDELIRRVYNALQGDTVFDVNEPDFNYPSLPKYVMYAIGSVTYGMGRSDFAFFVAARTFSALLGASVAALVYLIARMIGANKGAAFLAGVLYIVSGVAAANSRLAHNDLYLQFFTVLCLYFTLQFHYRQSWASLGAAFLSVGMAASSKYTGASMVLVPVGVLVVMHWDMVKENWLRFLGTLFAGAALVILGYGIGTPRLLVAPVDYLSQAVPAALRFSQYGFNSGVPIGLYGQWAVFESAVGVFAYWLFLAAFVWLAARVLLHAFGKTKLENRLAQGVAILLMNLILFDLPFLISINYIERHFIPFVPLFAILGALFVWDINALASNLNWKLVRPAAALVLGVGLVYSTLRLVSIALLFLNDARIPAGEYIAGIRGYQKSIEYTLYPPAIEKKRFMRAHNYPIYFVKYAGETVPTGGRLEFNLGEQGLLNRDTDYFVIDSYTYDRFHTPSVCETNPVECDFFLNLLGGNVANYRLLQEFHYELPPYLPRVTISAVNPDVLIFERVR